MPSLYIPTTDAQISNAFLATLNSAPGATYLAQAKSLGVAAAAQVLINATGKTTAATLATQIVANLGVTNANAKTIAENYLVTQINAAGGTTKFGSGLIAALDLFAGLSSDATFGAAASAYIDKVNSAVTYSNVSTNTSTDLSVLAAAVSSTGATAGSTFTLTTNADEFLPTSAGTTRTTTGDDTFNAGAGRLNTTDNVDGGAGNDTLNATLDAAVAPVVKNIEILNLSMRAGSLDMTDVSGETTVNVLGTQSGAVIGLSANAAVTLKDGYDKQVRLELGDATGTADSVTVISNGASGFSLVVTGIETLNLRADTNLVLGTTANASAISFGSAVRAVNVTGTGNATIFLGTAGNASGLSALSAVDASALGGALAFDYSISNAIKIVGGAGNDTINLYSGLDTLDTINGGAGVDTVRASIAAGGSTVRPTMSNVETLNLSVATAATVDLRAATSLETLNVTASTAALTVTQMSKSISTINFDTQTTAITAQSYTYADGSVSSVTLKLATTGTATAGVTLGDVTYAGNTGALTLLSDGISSNVVGAVNAATVNSVTVNVVKTLAMSAISAAGARSVTISGTNFTADDIWAAAAGTISISGSGTAQVGVGEIHGGSGLSTVNLNAGAGGDVTITTLSMGTGGTAADDSFALNIDVGSGGSAGVGTIHLNSGASAASLVSVVANGLGNVNLGFDASTGLVSTASIDSRGLTEGRLVLNASANTATRFSVSLGNGSGNNITLGGLADTVIGGATADIIEGGAGNDEIAGMGGADIFVYNSKSTAGAATASVDGIDVITDFSTADVILFKNLTAFTTANFGSSITGNSAIVQSATLTGVSVTSANFGLFGIFQRGSDVVVQVVLSTGASAAANSANIAEIILQGETLVTATSAISFSFDSGLRISNIVQS